VSPGSGETRLKIPAAPSTELFPAIVGAVRPDVGRFRMSAAVAPHVS